MLSPEIVNGLFALATTVIAAVIRMDYLNRKRLKEKLAIAEADIQFLLACEAIHCENNVKLRNASFKNRVRNEAFAKGHTWSGRFTPGRVRAETMRRTSTNATSVAAHCLVLAKHGVLAIAACVTWIGRKAVAVPKVLIERARTRGKAPEAITR